MAKSFSISDLQLNESIAFVTSKIFFTSLSNLIIHINLNNTNYLIFSSLNNLKIKQIGPNSKEFVIKYNKWPSLFFGTKSRNNIDGFIGKSSVNYKLVSFNEVDQIFHKNKYFKNDLKQFFDDELRKKMKIKFELKAMNQMQRLCDLTKSLKLVDTNDTNESSFIREFGPPVKKIKMDNNKEKLIPIRNMDEDNGLKHKVRVFNHPYKLMKNEEIANIKCNQNLNDELLIFPCNHSQIKSSLLKNYCVKCLESSCQNTYTYSSCLKMLVNVLVFYHCDHQNNCLTFNQICHLCI
jgi:hypothetical protein